MIFFRPILVCIFVVLANIIVGQLSDLTLKVMDELDINIDDCEGSLFAEKVLPYNNDLSVIVIPKIGIKDEEFEEVYSLDSYVVMVNNKTQIIKHLYFESYKTSGWDSDAIYITEISIDTAPYLVQENVRAFGIIIQERSMSQPNPYSSNFISLFIPDGDKLQNILKNYEIYSFGGETDMNCLGEFVENTKILKMLKNQTNGYFDIETYSINSEIVYTKKEDDCVESKKVKNSKQILKFSNGTYRTQKQ